MSDQVLEVPVFSDVPLYDERVTLDGQEYILNLDWNDTEGRWYLSLYTVDREPLALGLKIVPGVPLLRRTVDERIPEGHLMALDAAPRPGEAPGYLELGDRVRLYYFPKGVLP